MIEVRNLNKTYKSFKLGNASFDLESGEITGLIGVNGAGKSTILRILIGLVKSESGEISIDGNKVLDLGEKLRVGFVSQELNIYSDQKMSALSAFVKDIYRKQWNDDLFRHYMNDVFALKDDLKIKELSTGMRVKFFLAMELAKKPECLLLDEVTSGLDPMIRDEVLDILQGIAQDDNIPVLMSSHITEDLEKIADKIIYIDSGRILLEDTVENIKKNYYRINEEELSKLGEETRALILDKGIKQHQYYVYDASGIENVEKAGSPALLSDVLSFLRRGK